MNREEEIKRASAHFEALLRSQLERCDRMKNADGKTDFAVLPKIVIGLIDGDGIGPIIVKEAEKVLRRLLKEELASGRVELRRIEGLTIENRLKLGVSVPEETLKAIKECNVILKGPTTTPKGGTMESANVTLRRELDLFANVRPVTIPEQGIDWIFFRENTEGEYVLGSKGIDACDTLSFDFKVTTVPGTERIARAAFDYARANGKTEISLVTKANIMKKTDGRFSEICNRIISAEYPELHMEEWYIDIMTANLVNEAIRNRFQVFLLPNLYGDILTDEAAQIQGGVGTAGSANIGDRYAMFEAIHGSAPRMIEEGLGDYANPASILKATEMMLRHIGFSEKASLLASAVQRASDSLPMTGDRTGGTCAGFGEAVLKNL